MSEPLQRTAGDVFTVARTDDGVVSFTVAASTVDLAMELEPVSALWLARQLWQASGLPLDHGLRLRRRTPDAESETP